MAKYSLGSRTLQLTISYLFRLEKQYNKQKQGYENIENPVNNGNQDMHHHLELQNILPHH